MALLPWIKGKVIRIENETYDTRRFWIQIEEMDSFDFKPGQFVTLDLPIHEKSNKRWRSYSIASWPDGTNVFELLVVLDKEGTGTKYLFNDVSVGSILTLRGPLGVFVLKEPLDKDVFFICTGTGVAPFRSMIQHIINNKIPYKNIFLVFGCRTKADLLYYDEFKQLAAHPGFHFETTLSREQWEGRTGYVHPIYESLCASRQPASFYLCGWRGMIHEAKDRILNMGYDKSDIHLEIFG